MLVILQLSVLILVLLLVSFITVMCHVAILFHLLSCVLLCFIIVFTYQCVDLFSFTAARVSSKLTSLLNYFMSVNKIMVLVVNSSLSHGTITDSCEKLEWQYMLILLTAFLVFLSICWAFLILIVDSSRLIRIT